MNALERPPHNPYAAPASPPMLAARSARGIGAHWKWVYLGVSLVVLAVNVAVYEAAAIGLSSEVARTAVALVGPLAIARALVALMWISVAWSGLPAGWRGGMTPARAVLLLFVPAYGFYWMFAMNLRLCARLDDALQAGSDPRRAPKALAVLAATISLAATTVGLSGRLVAAAPWGAMVTTVASTAAWFAYMLACDPLRSAAAEIAARFPEDPNAHAQAPSSSLKLAYILPLGFLLFLLLIAIWQFLQPGTRR